MEAETRRLLAERMWEAEKKVDDQFFTSKSQYAETYAQEPYRYREITEAMAEALHDMLWQFWRKNSEMELTRMVAQVADLASTIDNSAPSCLHEEKDPTCPTCIAEHLRSLVRSFS